MFPIEQESLFIGETTRRISLAELQIDQAKVRDKLPQQCWKLKREGSTLSKFLVNHIVRSR